MSDPQVAPTLELLDVKGNGQACERFLWIRGLSDPTLVPKSRMDLVDDLQRFPGELRHVVAADGTMAALTATIRDAAGAGSCYLTVFARNDPGEPLLGDLVTFAESRARAGGVADVRCGDTGDRPAIIALQERHGFTVHDRWRRFHVDVESPPTQSLLDPDHDADGVRKVTLGERPDLLDAIFATYREGLHDAPGDFPRPDETAASWVKDIDSSPVLGRDLTFALIDEQDEVLAMVELERLAIGSDRAWVEFLTVARAHRGRGIAGLAKRHAVAHAATVGLRRLQTMNHVDNAAICALNEHLGWTEDPVRLSLRRLIAPA